MKRDLSQLANRTYDLLVIGGGIHGAAITWDAALRGLSVALIERDDFGGATSANSLKTVHGGLRYLQDADLQLVRKMISERKALLRIAPHLVHPLPVIMPTYKKFTKSSLAMTVALMMTDAVGFDRNHGQDAHKHLPHGRVVSRESCLRVLPGINPDGITGAAIWYDGQIYNTERMLLAFIAGAAQRGAAAANYVEARRLLVNGTQVVGVAAYDRVGDANLEIRARLVVNTAGAWIDRLLETLNGRRPMGDQKFHLSTAWNIVTRKFIDRAAAGITSHTTDADGKRSSRVLFVSPWRDTSIIGTVHDHYHGRPEEYQVDAERIDAFLAEVNRAYPGAALTLDDVRFVHKGFLPTRGTSSVAVKLLRDGTIHDHAADYGLDGLVSVVGVKYTSARGVAGKAVDLAFKKLGRTAPPSRTHTTPLHGGAIEQFADFYRREIDAQSPRIAATTARQLLYNYGSEYRNVLAPLADDPSWGQTLAAGTNVIRAEVLHAVREEMAVNLSDVVFRRTELGSAGNPGPAALRACAEIMAAELRWSPAQIEREIALVEAKFPTFDKVTAAVTTDPVAVA